MTKTELLRTAKPILFNTDMVRAILDGRKTVTRRICKDGNDYVEPDMSFYDANKRTYAVHNYANKEHTKKLSLAERICPICPSDILYVRETYCPNYFDFTTQYGNGHGYKADYDNAILSSNIPKPKWTPSLHMPKQAARIFLKVKDVRAERLQDMETIDDRNYISEGVKDKHDFIHIWDATVKDKEKYGWYANPWVWVIEFERIYPDDYMEV
ncbi:MAG: hypothetical protein HDQ97_05965 [Lachnospiraceae bacterium]|nr:hypothetical protein [Lachnospiraceae bacterium]